MPDWVHIAIGALGGTAFTEIVRRVIPSSDKALELQIKREADAEELQLRREADTAKTEGDLRKALWDEIDRLTKKIIALEAKLDQSAQAIHALKAENVVQRAEIELLSRRLGLDFKSLES